MAKVHAAGYRPEPDFVRSTLLSRLEKFTSSIHAEFAEALSYLPHDFADDVASDIVLVTALRTMEKERLPRKPGRMR
jgi:hypothetical protein